MPHKTAGRFKKRDLTADVKIRMCFEEGDLLSGHLNASARRHKCEAATVMRSRDQCAEGVLTQRDTATRELLGAEHDIYVLASLHQA